MNPGSQGLNETRARPQLKVGRFCVEELLGETPFRTRHHSEGSRRVVSCHHGGTLEEVLENRILLPRQKSRGFQYSKGESRRQKTLLKSPLPAPAPAVGILRAGEQAVRNFKTTDFSPESAHDGKGSQESAGSCRPTFAGRHDSDPAESISKTASHQGGKRCRVGSFLYETADEAIHLALKGGRRSGNTPLIQRRSGKTSQDGIGTGNKRRAVSPRKRWRTRKGHNKKPNNYLSLIYF